MTDAKARQTVEGEGDPTQAQPCNEMLIKSRRARMRPTKSQMVREELEEFEVATHGISAEWLLKFTCLPSLRRFPFYLRAIHRSSLPRMILAIDPTMRFVPPLLIYVSTLLLKSSF